MVSDSSSFGQSEQRYLPRWKVENRVEYQLEKDPDTYEAITRDLSCAGACLKIHKKFVDNQKIKLTVYLSDEEPIHLTGNILWIESADSESNLLGISFINVHEDVQQTILNHAFEVNKEVLQNHWFKGWEGLDPAT